MIEPGWSILLTAISGTIAWLVWQFGAKKAEEYGYPEASYKALLAAELLFVIPVAAIAANLLEGFWYVWKGEMFWGSPLLHQISQGIWKIWFLGVLILTLGFCLQIILSHMRLRNMTPCEKEASELFEEICQKTGVKPEKVNLMRSYRISSPVQVGIVRQKIVLPENSYSPEELVVILTHELIHVKQRSNLAKLLACTACIVQWFNPTVWALRKEVFRRSEYACDDESSQLVGQKNYYLLLRQITMKDNERQNPLWSSIGEKECDIVERTRRAAWLKSLTRKKASMLRRIILSAGLCVSLMAASTAALAEGYIAVTRLTESNTEHPPMEFPEVVHEETVPGGILQLVDLDTEVQAKGVTEFNWTVASGIRKLSQQIYLEKGQHVLLSGFISPDTIPVQVGIRNSSLQSDSATVTGMFTSAFSVNASGYYRIFVQNTSGSTVSVYFSATIY